jgi:hypothetical protein
MQRSFVKLELVNPSCLNYLKWIKNEEDTRVKIEMGLVLFFQNIEANYHSSSSCVLYVGPLHLRLKEHLWPSNLHVQ